VSSAPDPDPVTYEDSDYAPWLEVESDRIVRLVRLLTEWIWDHVYRLRSHGAEHIPPAGAFLMVPNHSSYIDPFVQVRGQSRVVHYMAKSSLLETPIIGRIVKAGGGFPVRRGRGDGFAIELARRLLRAGAPVVIYPEGTRYRDSIALGPARRGAARIALEMRVPVVPVATWGNKARAVYGRPRWRRPKLDTVFGEPMDFTHLDPTPENVERVRDEIWSAVTELYERARVLNAAR